MTYNGDSSLTPPPPLCDPNSSAGSNIDNDMFALETMHQRLSQSFKSGVVPPSSPVSPDTADSQGHMAPA